MMPRRARITHRLICVNRLNTSAKKWPKNIEAHISSIGNNPLKEAGSNRMKAMTMISSAMSVRSRIRVCTLS